MTLVVELDTVSKHYAQVTALDSVNLQLQAGEVMGLFGHNGAGKTTIMKLILGVTPACSGVLRVFGMDPLSSQAFASRKKIGYLPENVSFYDHLTGLQVLNYFANLKSVPKTMVLQLLEQVGLTHAKHRTVKTYSKGMRQRLGLAQAFLGEPKLLLLDEPTIGLDPIATQEFYQSVDKLKSDGASIILCSHILPGTEQHIDKAMIMSCGQPLAHGSLINLRQQAQLPITIHTLGLGEAMLKDDLLRPYVVKPNILMVPEQHKMSVIKCLTRYDNLTDIHIEPAGLGQLYEYYLASGQDSINQSKQGAKS
ncbi:MAG: ABC transporter ATP-binding protein [Gammaproteobacteria bacterium]|nr:ABC transporter ATP-binding protein [Gammaproteobacteria bacterium]MCP4879116.1 ABC transporter ATP-binding protein [Gammaproteobacteria bacterium]